MVGPMEAWCYFLIHGETLDTARLPDTLRTALVPEAMEALVMFTQDEIERARYLSRKMAHHDHLTAVNDAIREGILGRTQLCQRLLNEPESSEQDVTNMSIAQLQTMAEELENRLKAKVQ